MNIHTHLRFLGQRTACVFCFILTFLSVQAQPANDECANATVLTLGQGSCSPTPYTNVGATASNPPGSGCGQPGYRDIWFKATSSTYGFYITTGLLPAGSTAIDIYDACGGTMLWCSFFAPNYTHLIPVGAGTYYIRVSRPIGAPTGDINLCAWNPPPAPNDGCSTAIVLPMNTSFCNANSSNYSNVGSTASGTTGCGNSAWLDYWFETTSTQPSFTIEIGDVPFSTGRMSVYSACGGGVVYCGVISAYTSWLITTTPGNYKIRISWSSVEPAGDIGICAWEVQPNNGVTFINNLPDMELGQTAQIVIDNNGGGGIIVEVDNIDGSPNIQLEKWVWNGVAFVFDVALVSGMAVAWESGNLLKANAISSDGSNPCGSPSGEDEFFGTDVDGNSIANFVCAYNPTAYRTPFFKAQPQRTGTELIWRTASESNNSYFEVEHSLNGVSFQSIGVVAGHGTTNEPNEYGYSHECNVQGKHYYRLRQVDYDGKISFSNIVVVNFENSKEPLVSPNPVKDVLKIQSEGFERLFIFDAFGKQVKEASYVQSIDVSALPSGIYVLMFLNGRQAYSERFIKE